MGGETGGVGFGGSSGSAGCEQGSVVPLNLEPRGSRSVFRRVGWGGVGGGMWPRPGGACRLQLGSLPVGGGGGRRAPGAGRHDYPRASSPGSFLLHRHLALPVRYGSEPVREPLRLGERNVPEPPSSPPAPWLSHEQRGCCT